MTKSKLFFGDWPATVSRSSRNSAEGQLDFTSKESPGTGKRGKLTTFNPFFLQNWLMIGLIVFGLFASFQSSATTCPNATVIPAAAALPYTSALTCGTANDISAVTATACGSTSYLGGLESVFTWTPSSNYINGSIDYAGVTWTGIMLYNGCPTSGGTCIANITNSAASKSLSGLTFTAGVTYFIVIDTWPSPASPCPGNITINGTLNVPCAGTPTPGNTVSSATSACTGVPFNLSLQNPTSGAGVTYVWTSADDAAFTTNVQTLASTASTASVASITSSKYYRCLVSCSNSGQSTYSTPVFVSLSTYCPCIPVYTTGKTDGDLISNISISGTTLSNNTGTAPVNPAYTYFSGQPNYTATLQAGSSYVVSVTVGTFGSQNMAAWIDYNDNAIFEASERIGFTTASIGSNGSATFNIVVSCSPPLGTHRLRIRDVYATAGNLIDPCASYGYGETEDYDVTITAAVACPAPSGLAAAPTGGGANLTWTAGCVETNWNVHVTSVGGGAPTGAASNPGVTTNSLAVSGLDPATQYEAWVQADCNVTAPGNGQSTWFGPVVFTTSATCLPPTALVVTNITSSDAEVNFTAPATGSPAGYSYYVSTSSATPATTILGTPITGPGTTQTTLGNALLSNTLHYVWVRSNCGNMPVSGNPNNSAWSAVASFTTLQLPCAGTPSPGATLSTVSSTCPDVAFTLSLQNPSTNSGFTYLWQSADDAAFTTNVQTLSSTTETQTIASQTVASYYRCTVTCGPSGLSTVATPVFVNQNSGLACYCIPVTTLGCTDGDVIAQVVLNTLNNNSGTGCPSGTLGYSDYTSNTSLTTNLIAGNTYSCQVWAGQYSESYAAWIDYNADGVFDNVTEKIGFTSSPVAGSGFVGVLGSSASFPVVISCNPTPGTYRLRVRAMFNIAGSAVTPCGANTYGETEDYLITIDPPLPCPAPSALVASNPTTTSVDLNWTIGCSETAWNIEYGPTGFTPGTGTSVAVTTNPATVSGLACVTSYDFYVYANCGGAGSSLPSTVASATTGICPCTGTPTPGNTIVAGTACTAGSTVNLSLQNATTGSSVTYQWQSADDAAFTTNVVNLGTGATQVGTVNGPTYFRCQVTCATGPASAFSTPVLVDISTVGTGNTFADPIIIGAAPCSASPYTNTVNNGACFTNDLAGSQASPDVFYQFTLAAPATVQASLCGSGFDTYIHLLDNTGAILQFNDDNGPLCAGNASSLSVTLAAGTYYIVTEGFSSNLGNLSLTLNTTDPCSASMNITAFVEGYYLSGSSPAAMAAASYDNLVNSGSATPGNATDVCLVTVELWPDALGSTYSATGMLNTDGSLSVTFPAAALGGTYWIALTSPNTLRTFSASSITLASTNTYNFSSSLASAATDGSADPLATLTTGLFGLRSGDINQDEFIDGTDYAVFEGDVINSANGAFSLPSDLNGDSFVDGTDYPILDVNSASGFYSQYPAFL